ncbi:ketohexokinase [Plakobranchus ocellatus]|uniref:Ketohexokinase n=1 Tax=Plakobranchus ocellatus TaxID=259542 RepID=A0AAV3YRN7_9GAST|nr:ketohexokinase [Plakobranchus ocellatus]
MMEKVPPTDCGKVLCVGLACIDLVNIVAEFPQEDSDKSWIVADFHKCGISTERCVRKDVQCSVATVIVSRDAGTRTIIYHPRDHPELTFEDFDKEFNGDFSSYSWIHFELTRKVSDVCKMMDSILSAGCTKSSADTTEKSARLQSRPVVSVELEKPEILDAELPREQEPEFEEILVRALLTLLAAKSIFLTDSVLLKAEFLASKYRYNTCTPACSSAGAAFI